MLQKPLGGDRAARVDHRAHQLLLVTTLMQILGLLMVLLMAVAFVRTRGWRYPALTAYALVAVAMIVMYSDVSSRPRMVLAVLPGFVWAAAWLPRRVTIALSACFLVLLAAITYAWAWSVTP